MFRVGDIISLRSWGDPTAKESVIMGIGLLDGIEKKVTVKELCDSTFDGLCRAFERKAGHPPDARARAIFAKYATDGDRLLKSGQTLKSALSLVAATEVQYDLGGTLPPEQMNKAAASVIDNWFRAEVRRAGSAEVVARNYPNAIINGQTIRGYFHSWFPEANPCAEIKVATKPVGCPRCGHAGDFIRMALCCPQHGVFGGC